MHTHPLPQHCLTTHPGAGPCRDVPTSGSQFLPLPLLLPPASPLPSHPLCPICENPSRSNRPQRSQGPLKNPHPHPGPGLSPGCPQCTPCFRPWAAIAFCRAHWAMAGPHRVPPHSPSLCPRRAWRRVNLTRHAFEPCLARLLSLSWPLLFQRSFLPSVLQTPLPVPHGPSPPALSSDPLQCVAQFCPDIQFCIQRLAQSPGLGRWS